MPRAKNFPTIGNIFSNHWKTAEKFFQSLEKTAGFSNHWKNIFQSLETFFPTIGKLFPLLPSADSEPCKELRVP
jgi:hypothetical protein